MFLTQRLLWPLTRLAETIDLFERAMASTRRILNLIETPIRVRRGDEPLDVATVQGAVRFDDVSFGYGDGPDVLSHIDLDVPAGDTVAPHAARPAPHAARPAPHAAHAGPSPDGSAHRHL